MIPIKLQTMRHRVRIRRLRRLNDDSALACQRGKPPARHEERVCLLVFEDRPFGPLEAVDGVSRYWLFGVGVTAL